MSVVAGGIDGGIVTLALVASGRCELRGGEGNAAEHLTGIFRAAAGRVAAFLGGDGVIQHRHDQLGIPLQPHDGELSQGDKEPPLVTGKYQFFIKHFPDKCGDLDHAAAAALAGVFHTAAEHHGVQYLHCGHQFDRQY